MKYTLEDFDYDLPDRLIATSPAKTRDHSRLLVLDKKTGEIEHKKFFEIFDLLNKGDVLVLNDSKVIPARLMAEKAGTGGKVEVLLHKRIGADSWECLLGGRVKEGAELLFLKKKKNILKARILKNNSDGTWNLKFNKKSDQLMAAIIEAGEMPLPPYIIKQRKIKKEKLKNIVDQRAYQTVYAADSRLGSVAAPTAGLHFTKRLLDKLKRKGVRIEFITLYVGMGTFAPVKVDDFTKHKMHAEWVEIDRGTINQLKIKKEKLKNGRVIAVGTTTCRALEACFLKLGSPSSGSRHSFREWVDIFIYPGYEFKIVDALITNFHLPKSTLLMLVSALAGKENIDKAYQKAIKNRYKFYSYGDAMFINDR